MDSTTNVSENTGMQMYGNILQIYSTTYLSPHSSKTRFSVCMEDSHQVLILWIISVRSTGFRKFLTKGRCVISSGPIQMIVVAGEFLREVQGIHLDRTFQKHSITTIIWIGPE